MIRIYDGEYGFEVNNHADIDEVLEVMERLDDVYKHRSEIVSDLITIHKDILYYSLLHVITNVSNDSNHIIKEGIKHWDIFTKIQQKEVLGLLIKNSTNEELMDEEVRSWIDTVKVKN